MYPPAGGQAAATIQFFSNGFQGNDRSRQHCRTDLTSSGPSVAEQLGRAVLNAGRAFAYNDAMSEGPNLRKIEGMMQ